MVEIDKNDGQLCIIAAYQPHFFRCRLERPAVQKPGQAVAICDILRFLQGNAELIGQHLVL